MWLQWTVPRLSCSFAVKVSINRFLIYCFVSNTKADCRAPRTQIRRWLRGNNLASNVEVSRLEAIASRSKDATGFLDLLLGARD